MNFKNLLLVILATILLTACTTKQPFLNKPVSDDKLPALKFEKRTGNTDELSLLLTFSGGGTRAASLAYGVLKELKRQNLLSEIDVISSVSGGSFTSAYYGLYGEQIFEDFEEKFLKKPVQSRLIDTFINPFNWLGISFSNRSDYVAEYYEKEIFGEKTFGDLREDGPKIIINATDISTGNPFAFSPQNFHRICSDWETYPIGRAIVASSAVPIVFSPITLKNYGGCKPLLSDRTKTPRSYNAQQTLNLKKYNQKEQYKYLHLVDGGIADNLGIRSLLDIVAEYDYDFIKVMDVLGIPNSKKIVLIVVNAADTINPDIALQRESPNIETTMGAVSTIQLQRYNIDTLDLVNYFFGLWEKQVNQARCGSDDCGGIQFHLVELNFNQFDEKKAMNFALTETSLELPGKKVDELIEAGEYLLRNSAEFNRVLKSIRKKE